MLYDGAILARRGDVVVVTINYRLGAGLLRLRDRFGQACRDRNEGMLDQVAALEWCATKSPRSAAIRNVTIFGESAGAMSCATLLGMPRAAASSAGDPPVGAATTYGERRRARLTGPGPRDIA